MEVSKTDLTKAVKYLSDAAKLYDALAVIPSLKCNSRSYMINQLIVKLNKLLNTNDQKRIMQRSGRI